MRLEYENNSSQKSKCAKCTKHVARVFENEVAEDHDDDGGPVKDGVHQPHRDQLQSAEKERKAKTSKHCDSDENWLWKYYIES